MTQHKRTQVNMPNTNGSMMACLLYVQDAPGKAFKNKESTSKINFI